MRYIFICLLNFCNILISAQEKSLNKIAIILFLNIGNKTDAKFNVIQIPNLIIISRLFVPKKECINITIHHIT